MQPSFSEVTGLIIRSIKCSFIAIGHEIFLMAILSTADLSRAVFSYSWKDLHLVLFNCYGYVCSGNVWRG